MKNKKDALVYERDTVKISNISASMERVFDSNLSKLAPKTYAKPHDNCFIVGSTPSKSVNNMHNIQKTRKKGSHKKALKCNWSIEEVVSY